MVRLRAGDLTSDAPSQRMETVRWVSDEAANAAKNPDPKSLVRLLAPKGILDAEVLGSFGVLAQRANATGYEPVWLVHGIPEPLLCGVG